MLLKLQHLAAKVAIGYAIVAAVWITLSDRVLEYLVRDPVQFTFWSTLKGWFFVAITAALLFAVLRREVSRAADSARRRDVAEDALRESEARLRLIAETINEIFWIRDPVKNRFLYVSPGFERIWGRPVSELVDSPHVWTESILPEDRERVLHSVATREIAGEHAIEFRIIRPDGAIHWIDTKTFPVTDSSGNVTRIVGIAQDVTARKRLEQQFLRAQRLESVGTLAGGVAHDLNNILAPILMGASMLKRDEARPEERQLIGMIETAAHRGAGIIRQLLAFSRGIEGKRSIVQVRHLLKEIVTMIRETFPRNVTVRLRAEGDLWPVHADATLLHQVFMNLCVNARDAMPAGGELMLSAENATLGEDDFRGPNGSEPGSYVVVEVKDTGEGIPAENMDQIFDPFFTTKEQGRGTGLGLSTVLGIVKSHGGFVTVSSETGNGSSFRIHLPASPEHAAEGETGAEETSIRGQGELVMVVDDEEDIQETSRRVLEESGFRVLTARNGEEAIALFLERRGDVRLVMTDLIMPVMDGIALIRALRPLDPDVPIIATSGLSEGIATAELKAFGVTTVLAKPHSAQMMLQAVADELRRSVGRPPSAPEWGV